MNLVKNLVLVALIAVFGLKSLAQSQVDVQQIGSNIFNYEINPHPVPSTQQAQFSYLWWFGDGGFSFDKSPEYRFLNDSGGNGFSGRLITTESYGTGGVPPLAFHTPTNNTGASGNSVSGILENNEFFKVQHYRNAVPDDTLYLIITYKNPDNSNSIASYRSGFINLKFDEDYLRYENTLNPVEHCPKGEIKDPSTLNWKFRDINGGQETSFLVSLKGSEELAKKIEEKLSVIGTITFDQGATGMDKIEVPVSRSHDPNQMSSNMAANEKCNLGGHTIRYHIDFENVGDSRTSYIKLEVNLDDNLNMNTISNITTSKGYPLYSGAFISQYDSELGKVYSVDTDVANHTLNIGLNAYKLEGGHVLNKDLSKGWVEFDIVVNSGYVIGQDIISATEIYFDANPPIATNNSVISCKKALVLDTTSNGESGIKSPFKFPLKWIGIGLSPVLLAGGYIFFKKKKKGITKEEK